ncbi:uncharacterized protein LOC126282465 [Schistocerca gregaria]|uniref:uncharacterized protein LOC126282465 n=1 Tax=Schistocerca gregaria TaxID=7010 RepID=UPI00211F28E3|nr:uncharacterized protein LOC126282465 [Schistocerca gregaria]
MRKTSFIFFLLQADSSVWSMSIVLFTSFLWPMTYQLHHKKVCKQEHLIHLLSFAGRLICLVIVYGAIDFILVANDKSVAPQIVRKQENHIHLLSYGKCGYSFVTFYIRFHKLRYK